MRIRRACIHRACIHRSVVASTILAAVVSLTACATTGPDSLVHLEVHGKPAENGKTLNVRFDEIERTPDESIVQVGFQSGGSVSSSMFIMRGVCAVAMARDARYVMSKPVEGVPGRYRLTFFEREDDAPRFRYPHLEGRPDRTGSEAISKSMCGLVRLLTAGD